jgi:hypothetical protein
VTQVLEEEPVQESAPDAIGDETPEAVVEPVAETQVEEVPEPEPEPVAETQTEDEVEVEIQPEPVLQELDADMSSLEAVADGSLDTAPSDEQVDFRSQPISDEVAHDLVASLENNDSESFEPAAASMDVGSMDEGTMEPMDLEAFGIAPIGAATDEAAPASADDVSWTDAANIGSFDAPKPDELVTSTPEMDPFVQDLFAEPSTSRVGEEPPAPPAAPSEPDIPVSSSPSGEQPSVDRAAVARELAGLFSDEERPRARPSAPLNSSDPSTPDERKRVEDDDQVTKGIISRLIDGVKGL